MKTLHMALAILGSIFLISTIIVETNLLVFFVGTLYLSIYCLVVSHLSRLKDLTFSMNLFLIFFWIGHVVKTALVLRNQDLHQVIGWEAIGTFDFSVEDMSTLFAVETATLLGGFVCIKLFVNKKPAFQTGSTFPNLVNNSELLLVSWALVSVSLILFIDQIGIGRHGLDADGTVTLPFGLGGFLVYVRNIALPVVGLVFLQWYLTDRLSYRWVGYCLYIFVIALYSYFALSRSTFVVAVMPLIINYFVEQRSHLARIAIVGFFSVCFLVVMSMMDVYRQNIYNAEIFGLGLLEVVQQSMSARQILVMTDFIFNRIEGSRELMAVISSDIKGLPSLINTVFFDAEGIIEAVMGFNPGVEGMAFGVTYGLAGLLFLSGSYLVVFFGVIFYFAVLFSIERLFLARGFKTASIFLATVIFINIWGNMVWFFFLRYILMAMFSYFLVLAIEKSFSGKKLDRIRAFNINDKKAYQSKLNG